MCRRLIIYVTDYTNEEEPYIRWSKICIYSLLFGFTLSYKKLAEHRYKIVAVKHNDQKKLETKTIRVKFSDKDYFCKEKDPRKIIRRFLLQMPREEYNKIITDYNNIIYSCTDSCLI